MAEYPALPLFTDAYMADTRHLTTAQHGAYLLLLMVAWRMPDCMLPDDDIFLSRCAGMSKHAWSINKAAVMSFWKRDGERFYQARLLDERKYVDELKQKNSRAGKLSALKRHNRGSTTVVTERQPKSNPHTHTLPIEETLYPFFDKFWAVFPKCRAGNKDKSYTAYKNAITRGATENQIYDAAVAYAVGSEATKDGGMYAKGCAAWLNADRWADKKPPPKTIDPRIKAMRGG